MEITDKKIEELLSEKEKLEIQNEKLRNEKSDYNAKLIVNDKNISAYNEIDLVLFFRDPLTAQPHEPDVNALFRLCDVHNIPLATNVATAEVLIKGLERGDLDWRNIVNEKKIYAYLA